MHISCLNQLSGSESESEPFPSPPAFPNRHQDRHQGRHQDRHQRKDQDRHRGPYSANFRHYAKRCFLRATCANWELPKKTRFFSLSMNRRGTNFRKFFTFHLLANCSTDCYSGRLPAPRHRRSIARTASLKISGPESFGSRRGASAPRQTPTCPSHAPARAENGACHSVFCEVFWAKPFPEVVRSVAYVLLNPDRLHAADLGTSAQPFLKTKSTLSSCRRRQGHSLFVFVFLCQRSDYLSVLLCFILPVDYARGGVIM